MATQREQKLAALAAKLATLSGPTVVRNRALPADVPAEGWVNLLDGDPGEPEVVLSPIRYSWTHVAEIEIVVEHATDATRTTLLDDILAGIGALLEADRTLGGAVDYVSPGAPSPNDFAEDGNATLRGAVVPVTLIYDSTDALI